MEIYNKYCLTIIVIIAFAIISYAQDKPPQDIKILKPVRADIPPVLDGDLDDEVWKSGPIIDDIFISYDPVDGEVLPQRTAVYMAFDLDNLYFAFYCYDTEPNKIKTSVTRRDNLWHDDWVGFSLDATNSRQSAYDLFVNPNGMQADIHRTASSQDSYTDWVWYSGGKVVDNGYIIEMRIPLKNIRFASGKNVEMGILFWRRISRLGMSGAWPEIKIGEGVFKSMAKVVYSELDAQLKLEVLPSVTYSGYWNRLSPEEWSSADSRLDFGLSGTYGITSKITADFTVNPDFSQVESDQFQVLVNQRYELFYSEKRPFFMEAGNIFNVAATWGDSWMRTPVHTRRIVDPAWGARLTGELGNNTFALLAAGDEWPGKGLTPYAGMNANYMIGRSKFSLGGDNYIGLLYSGREFGDQYNRVIGADCYFRLGDGHQLQGHYFYSFTDRADDNGSIEGKEFNIVYNYFDKPIGIKFQVEHFDDDFEMDTAYYLRKGITRYIAYIGPVFYPNPDKVEWIKSITPVVFGTYLHDHTTDMDDTFLLAGVRGSFTKQGYVALEYRHFTESYSGELFDQDYFYGYRSAQLTNWLHLQASVRFGDRVYYDPNLPLFGYGLSTSFDFTIQPDDNLTQDFSYTYTDFIKHSNDEEVYDYNIFISRTTYQINKYLFIRAIFQYDSYLDLLLTDLLASFTLIPGTVIHVGYGSIHQELEWWHNEWLQEDTTHLAQFYQTRQSLFFKASYLFQF